MNKNIQRFFDGALSLPIIFLTAYFLFSFSGKDTTLVFLASLSASFAAGALWCGFLAKKPIRKDYSNALSFFIYKSAAENAKYFYDRFKRFYDCTIRGNAIDFGKFDLRFHLKPDALSCNQAVTFALGAKKKTILVVSKSAKDAVYHASKAGKNLTIVDFEFFAPLLDKTGALPTIEKIPLRKKLSAFLDAALRPVNAKRFFPAAGIMFALSILNGFSAWFLAFSAILAALGTVALVRGVNKTADT